MIDRIDVSRPLTKLVDLVIEAASEHAELRVEDLHCRDDAEHRRNELRISAARARRDTARDALFIALGINPHDEPPF